MTFSEFKAWLDGFSDAMSDAPTPEQWAKIKAKLAQVREPQSYGTQFNPMPVFPRLYEPNGSPLDLRSPSLPPHPAYRGTPVVTYGPNGSGGVTARDNGTIRAWNEGQNEH